MNVTIPNGWPPYTFADLRAHVRSVQRHERLTELKRVLLAVPADRFDLSVWVRGQIGSCGFAGCAVGWAMCDSYFDGIGLTLHGGIPKYRGRYCWGSSDAGVVFRITPQEGFHLFAASSYVGNSHDPRPVIARIDALLAQYPVLPDPRAQLARQQAPVGVEVARV